MGNIGHGRKPEREIVRRESTTEYPAALPTNRLAIGVKGELCDCGPGDDAVVVERNLADVF